MRITKITSQKRKGRFNVFVDGKYSFALSEEDIVKEKLKIGVEVGEERLNKLKFQGLLGLWFTKILNFLSYRPRSEKEVKDKLKEMSFKEKSLEDIKRQELSDLIIEKAKKLNLINDEEFGRWYIQGRQQSPKPMGAFRIKRELLAKGLDKLLIDELLKSEQTFNDKDLIVQTAEKKAKSLKRYDVLDFKRKLSTYLLRRGLSWEAVSSVVDTIAKRQYNKSQLDND